MNNGSVLTVPFATGLLATDTDTDTAMAYLTTKVASPPTKGTLDFGAF